MIKKAMEIARKAHSGQLDKIGDPYFLHVISVMHMASKVSRNPEIPIIGILHDVIEDTDVVLDDLRDEGFSESIIISLDYLTRRKNEDYIEYIQRVMLNDNAMTIKKQDIIHNLDDARLRLLSISTRTRLVKKYKRALSMILDKEIDLWTKEPTS